MTTPAPAHPDEEQPMPAPRPPADGPQPRPRAVLAMHQDLPARLIDPHTMARLTALTDIDPAVVLDDFTTPAARRTLASTQLIVSGWGCPPIDADTLAAAPRLRAVVHAAGSVKHHITPACWERGIQVASAAWANALPVAEYTVAAVLSTNKRLLRIREDYRTRRSPHDWQSTYEQAGNYRRTVGILGASLIGRRVLELLRPYDLDLLLHDPYVEPAEAARLGARSATLDELCAAADVVSVHAPELPETRHLIDGRRLALMRDDSTLINTARGSLVDQDALTAELLSGRLNAVIDVTVPEVLPPTSPLYDLPNLVLTPHIAGSLGGELHRMAAAAVDEVALWTAGRPFAHPVAKETISRTA